MVWALARLECYSPAFMDAVGDSLAPRLQHHIPQHLSNLASELVF